MACACLPNLAVSTCILTLSRNLPHPILWSSTPIWGDALRYYQLPYSRLAFCDLKVALPPTLGWLSGPHGVSFTHPIVRGFANLRICSCTALLINLLYLTSDYMKFFPKCDGFLAISTSPMSWRVERWKKFIKFTHYYFP